MSFIESRLLDCVSYGTQGGPTYYTRVVSLLNGRTRRNQEWSLPKYRFTVLYNNLDPADHVAVLNAFHACGGAAIGFRLKDWSDYTGTQTLTASATGSPETAQLAKTYTFGATTRTRTIKKPVAGTVVISGAVTSSVDTTTGIVSFTGTLGQPVTCTYEFDVPVRFESDDLQFSIDNKGAAGFYLTANVNLIEDFDA